MVSVRQEQLSNVLDQNMKSVGEGTKTRVNINIFLSRDVPDDGFSDNDAPDNQLVSWVDIVQKLFLQSGVKTWTFDA